jgi:sporulation protein YlmC with PRC-barrel domain
MTTNPSPPERLEVRYHLLDRQILDRDGGMVAKVDDVELTEQDGTLFISALLLGNGVLGPRIGGRRGAWMAAIWRRLHPREHPVPGRIDISRVSRVDSAVHLRDARAEIGVDGFEHWALTKVVARLPLFGKAGSPPARREPDGPSPGVTTRRASELLGRRVLGPDNVHRGHVSDLRVRTHFVDDATGWHTGGMTVTDLILNQKATAVLLGYERRNKQGPWLLRLALRALRPTVAGTIPWRDARIDWAGRDIAHTGRALEEFVP